MKPLSSHVTYLYLIRKNVKKKISFLKKKFKIIKKKWKQTFEGLIKIEIKLFDDLTKKKWIKVVEQIAPAISRCPAILENSKSYYFLWYNRFFEGHSSKIVNVTSWASLNTLRAIEIKRQFEYAHKRLLNVPMLIIR